MHIIAVRPHVKEVIVEVAGVNHVLRYEFLEKLVEAKLEIDIFLSKASGRMPR